MKITLAPGEELEVGFKVPNYSATGIFTKLDRKVIVKHETNGTITVDGDNKILK